LTDVPHNERFKPENTEWCEYHMSLHAQRFHRAALPTERISRPPCC
jgi:hypothetical protein